MQEETDKVLESGDFLKLDEASVIFILKQGNLKLNEVELWNHVVRWAKHQVAMNPTKTVRDCLEKILGYVRFLTFTSDEISEHILPVEVLSPEEFMDLALAVSQKQPLQSSLLCNVREKRNVCQGEELEERDVEGEIEEKVEYNESALSYQSEKDCESVDFDKLCCFRASDHFDLVLKNRSIHQSSFIIIPHVPIEIESLTCSSRPKLVGSFKNQYNYDCVITVEKTFMSQEICTLGNDAWYDGIIKISLKFNSGLPIRLNPNEKWKFLLNWDIGHPVYHLKSSDQTWGDVYVTKTQLKGEDLTIVHDGPFHVYEIAYKKQ